MRPLEGCLAIAVEQAVAAPLCSKRLAQAGARVIKVERPEGDFARGYDSAARGESAYFTWLNQGKESVTLDFKTGKGARLLRALLGKADIMVENLRPGALEKAGFGRDALTALNPRLITCSISGFGSDGPLADRPAYDLLVQAETGLIAVSGSAQAPGRIGVSVCDIGAGLTAYSGVLEALIARGRTGRGSHIAVSLFDVAADWMAVPYLHARYGDGAPQPLGLKHPSIAPYGAFPCADGRLVLIAVQNEREWQRLCREAFADPELAGRADFSSNAKRVAHRAALDAALARHTGALSSQALGERLTAAGIAFGALNGADDLAHHAAFRTIGAKTAEGRSLELPADPVRWLDGDEPVQTATPAHGADSEAIIREFLGEAP